MRDPEQALWNIISENHPDITRDAYDAVMAGAWHIYVLGPTLVTERELREATEPYDRPKQDQPYRH